MKDQAKWMEWEVKSTEPSKPYVFVRREMPNGQLKNQVTYDYRIPTRLHLGIEALSRGDKNHRTMNT
jgi:hypothetical protein